MGRKQQRKLKLRLLHTLLRKRQPVTRNLRLRKTLRQRHLSSLPRHRTPRVEEGRRRRRRRTKNNEGRNFVSSAQSKQWMWVGGGVCVYVRDNASCEVSY